MARETCPQDGYPLFQSQLRSRSQKRQRCTNPTHPVPPVCPECGDVGPHRVAGISGGLECLCGHWWNPLSPVG